MAVIIKDKPYPIYRSASSLTKTDMDSADEFDSLFDYKYYVRYVDEMFEKVGLK